MTDCCSSQCENKPKTSKRDCPSCEQKCLSVSLKTILHHIQQPWTYQFADEQYYYCGNTDCDAVYFSATDEVIYKPAIRTHANDAEPIYDALICFCFGVKKSDAATNKGIKAFVVEQTKQSMCSCDSANPSGRCCLKDFPKFN